MHYFSYKNNEFYCEGVRVSKIIERIGSPCYIYSYRTFTEHFFKLQSAFSPVNPLICYSVKANSNLSICKALVKLGAGLDVVSGGELYRALKVGVDPKKIVFAGVGKTEKEIEEAIKKGVLFFNVESGQELEKINEISLRLKEVSSVCLRLNPEVDAHTHRYITTAKKESKFGLNFSVIQEIIRNKNSFSNVKIRGIHIHIGSQITQTQPYMRAIKKTLGFMEEMRKCGAEFEYLNIGGGMGIIYKEEPARTAKVFAKAILPFLKKSGLKIILEPGRFIIGSAGILVSKVTFVKKSKVKNFVILDSGMNDLIRPALYDAYHQVLPLVKLDDRHKDTKTQRHKYDIVGPICESGDFLAKDRELSQVKAGDYLAVMSAGAYGFSMSSNYNSRPRPTEVLVKGNKFWVIRERETYKDLIAKEKMIILSSSSGIDRTIQKTKRLDSPLSRRMTS